MKGSVPRISKNIFKKVSKKLKIFVFLQAIICYVKNMFLNILNYRRFTKNGISPRLRLDLYETLAHKTTIDHQKEYPCTNAAHEQ